ncbi:MAG: nitrous oxide reductase family maturation protein NosD [Candidatus Odinarchaeota archaeon]
MHGKGYIHSIIAVLVLFTLFPPIHGFSSEQGIEVQAKQSNIQNSLIVITHNDNFSIYAIDGDGSHSDPYIIANTAITSTGPPGINISNTDAYFRIENITISGSTDPNTAGIWLENVSNGYIFNVTVTDSLRGFWLEDADNNTLAGNNVTGASTGFDMWYYNDHNVLIGNVAKGSTGTGFSVRGSFNTTLIGNVATGNGVYGFNVFFSDNCTLVGNNATGNGADGFILNGGANYNNLTGNRAIGNLGDAGFYIAPDSIHNTLTGCTAIDNIHGFYIRQSSNNRITTSTATMNSQAGFYIEDSSNYNSLTGNTVVENDEIGIHMTLNSNFNILVNNNVSGNYGKGIELEDSNNNTIMDNTVNGNTMNGFSIVSSDNNTFTGNTVQKNEDGFEFSTSSYNDLSGNVITGNAVEGVYLTSSCDYNYLTGNNVSGNIEHGIYLDNSNNNTVTGNTVTSNSYYGFELSSSHDNLFNANNVSFNTYYGFAVSGSDFNTFRSNHIEENTEHGIELSNSYNNSLTWNILDNNTELGIRMSSLSGDNLVYYNFFMDNNQSDVQAYDESSGNSWTNGTHGNYWSEYTGVDANNDGIGDTNYTLAGGLQVNDTRPLVSRMQLTGPGDLNIEAGSTGTGSIAWIPLTNLLPAGYELYKDGNLSGSGTWMPGSAIQVDVNVTGLPLGTYNYTLVIFDISGKTAANTTMLTVEDTTSPLIIYTGTVQISFEKGTTGNWFNASASDLYPGTYTIYRNGSIILAGNWTSGAIFPVNLDDLEPGVYNYTLVVRDTSGNTNSLAVTVTVSKPPSTPLDPGTVLVVLSLTGAGGLAGFYLWRRRKRKK